MKNNPVSRVFVSAVPLVAALFNPALQSAGAQTPKIDPRIRVYDTRDGLSELKNEYGMLLESGNRAVVGIVVRTSEKGDTLGLVVDDVTVGSPAEKAGITKGSRITAINGVSLRVSPSDADDEDLRTVSQRRLQREVAKAHVGDEVELRVSEHGQSRTVKVKTVRAADLDRSAPSAITFSKVSANENRPSLGISIGSTGTLRDTLGLFISSVVTAGPAEKAGVFEGDRIAAINGADVRVATEDAEDAQASSARMSRFLREVAKTAPGDKLSLRVYSAGHYREVQMTVGRASDSGFGGMRMNFGDSSLLLRTLKRPPRSGLRRGSVLL